MSGPGREPPRGQGSDRVTIGIVALLLVGAVVMGYQEVATSELVAEGAAAPDFTMTRITGETVRLSELKGKVVLLDFWATWCPPCREELPWLVAVARDYEKKGVVFLAASQDEVEDPKAQRAIVEEFVGEAFPELRPFAVYSTPDAAIDYLVRALPTMYVIDAQGRIVQAHRGATSERAVRRALDTALEAK